MTYAKSLLCTDHTQPALRSYKNVLLPHRNLTKNSKPTQRNSDLILWHTKWLPCVFITKDIIYIDIIGCCGVRQPCRHIGLDPLNVHQSD